MGRRSGKQQQSGAPQASGNDDRFGNVLAQLAAVREVPPPSGEAMAAGRRLFLNEAVRLRAANMQRPWRRLLRAAAPTVAALLALLALAGGTVAAAQNARPDALLYPVKTAWEDMRLALAVAPQSRAELALIYSERRVDEIVEMAGAGQAAPATVQVRLQRQVEQTLQYSTQLPDSSMGPFLLQVQARLRERLQQVQRAMSAAPEHSQAGLQATVAILERAQEFIRLGLDDPLSFRRLSGSGAGFTLFPSPTPLGPSAGPTDTARPRGTRPALSPSRPATTGQADGPSPTPPASPSPTPAQATPTAAPTQAKATPCGQTPGPDNTPGPADNTPGPPNDMPGHPDNTPGADYTPGPNRSPGRP